MGKAAILIVLASLALGSMYAFGAKEDANKAEGRLSDHQYEVLARNAALAGYNKAKQLLAEDFSGAPASFEGTYADEAYEVTITLNGTTARVIAVGTATSAGGNAVEYTVDATIQEETTVKMAEKAPPFMRYALIAEEDLQLNGNILTEMYLAGSDDNPLNANMHTNGNMQIQGNAVTVRGFGSYVGSASASPASALYDSFEPYENKGTEVCGRVPYIEIADFDATAFASKATPDETTTGPVVLSGTYDLGGTREDPYVWHIEGDLSATGGTTINGYTMFVVDGNVAFAGNVDAGGIEYDGADESSVAFYASGQVDLAGNARVYGQIFAGSGVSFLNGTPRVYGSVTSKGAVTLSGTPKIYYRVASPALTTVFEEGVTEYKLISYAEH